MKYTCNRKRIVMHWPGYTGCISRMLEASWWEGAYKTVIFVFSLSFIFHCKLNFSASFYFLFCFSSYLFKIQCTNKDNWQKLVLNPNWEQNEISLRQGSVIPLWSATKTLTDLRNVITPSRERLEWWRLCCQHEKLGIANINSDKGNGLSKGALQFQIANLFGEIIVIELILLAIRWLRGYEVRFDWRAVAHIIWPISI